MAARHRLGRAVHRGRDVGVLPAAGSRCRRQRHRDREGHQHLRHGERTKQRASARSPRRRRRTRSHPRSPASPSRARRWRCRPAPGTRPPSSYSYQWQRSTDGGQSWSPISATGTSYVLGTPDLAARVRVNVTASNAYGSVSVATAVVGPITSGAPAKVSAPVIAGTAQQGQKLTATSGGWIPAATSFAYQWQRSTDNGLNWSPISGATATTYLLATADVGASVRVAVTATNSFGSAAASSVAPAPIASGAPHADRRADHHRHRPAGPDAERLDRQLESHRHVLRLSVAAFDRRRAQLDGHRRSGGLRRTRRWPRTSARCSRSPSPRPTPTASPARTR